MIIVGGSYREICIRPAEQRLRGSGLRAAIALSSSHDTQLLTAISEEDQVEFEAVTGAFDVTAEPAARSERVTFWYDTPVSQPTIVGLTAGFSAPVEADGDVVLRFGMLERDQQIRVNCRTLVVDPQGEPGALALEAARYEHLVVVANKREVESLARSSDRSKAALTLLEESGADAVVVKCGALGVVVRSGQGEVRLGPCPTTLVRPIGSGDVFTAAFADAYTRQGADVVEAARLAAEYTALFVSVPWEPAVNAAERRVHLDFADAVTVYLAGPFFSVGQTWLVEVVRSALRDAGASVFSPFHDVGLGGDDVAGPDLAGLNSADCVLALVDEFDPGTLFEVGYAVKAGKPVVAYLDPRREANLTMLQGSGVEITTDLATAVYRSIWLGMGE